MDPFTIVAPTASADGYGCSAEALVLAAVREHGADIAFVEHDWRDSRFTDPDLFELRAHESQIPDREVCVTYFLPFALARFRSRLNIGMSMWETDRLPNAWAACGQLADGYIVPSEHSREVFAQRMPCPVEVVPFGTDADLYAYHERDSERECMFLMTGSLHYRKGLEFALQALREEFDESEPVELVLKTRRGFLDAGTEWAMLDDPRVTVIDADFGRPDMVGLYHKADCLLAPSRGEGSGLTPRDAMATGLPVILTDWSGLAELADERYCYPVAVADLEPAPLDCTSYQHNVTGGGPIGNFARPSVPALRAAMRSVYENRTEALQRGQAAADWMRREWTWELCAYKWLRALERLTVSWVAAA